MVHHRPSSGLMLRGRQEISESRRWPPSTSPVPIFTASGPSRSDQATVQIQRLIPDNLLGPTVTASTCRLYIASPALVEAHRSSPGCGGTDHAGPPPRPSGTPYSVSDHLRANLHHLLPKRDQRPPFPRYTTFFGKSLTGP